ncbi:MAG: recombination protein RecR, recombination protein RecR [Candidatus Parcubacteria bacterium]|jgi:recombination protein RecR
MNPIDKLTEYFMNFPGIGPRQAKRFVYHLLTRDQNTLNEFADHIKALKQHIKICTRCFRFFMKSASTDNMCTICSNSERNNASLLIVPRDNDLEVIEKSKSYDGLYFVLGGTVPILEKLPEARIRIKDLRARIASDKAVIKEIILAANYNPEGENTMEYVEAELTKLIGPDIKITHLGRGFSTGTEIEYSDAATIKNALKNRF